MSDANNDNTAVAAAATKDDTAVAASSAKPSSSFTHPMYESVRYSSTPRHVQNTHIKGDFSLTRLEGMNNEEGKFVASKDWKYEDLRKQAKKMRVPERVNGKLLSKPQLCEAIVKMKIAYDAAKANPENDPHYLMILLDPDVSCMSLDFVPPKGYPGSRLQLCWNTLMEGLIVEILIGIAIFYF